MPKSDSAIKISYMCMLVEQMQSYRNKKADSRTLMMFTVMISYFLLAVGF